MLSALELIDYINGLVNTYNYGSANCHVYRTVM